MNKIFPIFVFLLLIFSEPVESKQLKLVVDNRYWYPFSYLSTDKQVFGIHIDIVKKALSSIGYDASIRALPKKRCINIIKNNQSDGMISLAYHPNLEAFIDFPPEADRDKRSKWRITQVDYVVATYNSSDYKFKGKTESLPSPVRIPYGETLASTLRNKNLIVDDGAKDDKANFKKLLRDKKGSVISTSIMAERLLEELEITNHITIHSTPFDSNSYHLGFSKNAKLTQSEKMKIWQEINRWRKDYVFMLQLYSKY